MKKISKLTVITTLITLLPIALGIALYDRLPDVVATHWGIDNQPNGWSSKAMAAFGMPGILALINLVCSTAMEICPDRPFADGKRRISWPIRYLPGLCGCAAG